MKRYTYTWIAGLAFLLLASVQWTEARNSQQILASNAAAAQEQVSGTVTDAQTGETLPGVNILVKGTTKGTSTDSEGNFELTVLSCRTPWWFRL